VRTKKTKIKKAEKKAKPKRIRKVKTTTRLGTRGVSAPREGLAGRPRPPAKRAPAKKPKKILPKLKIEKPEPKPERYWEALGRRKTAVARVRLLTKGEKEILVNAKPYQQYFSDVESSQIASAALRKMKSLERFRIISKIKGGGVKAQAEALRHGIARALVKFNPDFRRKLRKSGYLTRDSRMRERKKFGLKRARRAPQWKKR